MPVIDGLTVLQEIRNLHPSQPVIILTDAGTAAEEHQVRALGVTEYIVKKFALHLLGDSLNHLLIYTDAFGVADISAARDAATTSRKIST